MTVLRFLVVAGLGELTYLALFAMASRAGVGNLAAVTLAGGICTILNAFLHARISFRVRFQWSLLRDYAMVQLLCLSLSLGAGALLEMVSPEPAVIGVATMLLWAGASFLLSRHYYRQAR